MKNDSKMKRREQKMFIQSLGSSAYFLIGSIIFVAVQSKNDSLPPVAHFTVHMVWVSMHIDSSMVYLAINSELRESLFNRKETTTEQNIDLNRSK